MAPAAAFSGAAPVPVTLSVDAGRVVHTVSDRYVSANLDWHLDSEEFPAWVNSSANVIDLASPNLRVLAAGLAPAHLRIGGSEGDSIVFDTPAGGACAALNATPGFCLTPARLAALLEFAYSNKLSISFGLDAMLDRPSPAARQGARGVANVRALLEFMSTLIPLPTPDAPLVLEYGNELEYKVDVEPYAADVVALRATIDAVWAARGAPPDRRPLLVCNDENPDASYWSHLLPLVGSSVHAATWHLYVGYGLDPGLPSDAFNASFLSKINSTAALQVAAAANFTAAGGELWVGETALAWHSGRNGTTDAFASSPWYLTQLGTLAATHSVQMRQTLVGGYYELVDKFSFTPNPDYWLALLWKKVMGPRVLAAASSLPGAVLAFAHCGARPGTVALAWVNLDAAATYAVTVEGLGLPGGQPVPRGEYALSPVGGLQTAREVLLNGDEPPLALAPGPALPPLPPRTVADPAVPLLLAPHTLGFVELDGLGAGAGVCA